MIDNGLLSAADLSQRETIAILDTASEMTTVAQREVKKLPTLRGRTIVNLFYEDSTRTRISFEVAAKRLSADVINFAAKGSSVAKGESLKDTALTLQALGVDAVVVRHGASGAPHQLAQWLDAKIVNAGDGTHEHPTQALLDAYTIRDRLELVDFNGLRVGIVGDALHSRVARSNVLLLHTLGARVTLVGPPTLIPPQISQWPVEVSHSFDDALPELDVCMMLRVQAERMHGGFFPSAREYTAGYGLDRRRLEMLPKDALVLHPGPAVRGMEIASAVLDSPRVAATDQVRNGVAVRMAVLYQMLGGRS